MHEFIQHFDYWGNYIPSNWTVLPWKSKILTLKIKSLMNFQLKNQNYDNVLPFKQKCCPGRTVLPWKSKILTLKIKILINFQLKTRIITIFYLFKPKFCPGRTVLPWKSKILTLDIKSLMNFQLKTQNDDNFLPF